MQDKQQRLQQRLEPEIQAFRDHCQTLMLATVDVDGMPNVSYAPFALGEQGYYVLISDIARHARNLKQVPKVSLMLIDDEASSRQIYARQRLSFDAEVRIVSRDSAEWQHATAALQARHGEIVSNLTKMEDFTLFCLQPQMGLYVKGFGQAYRVNPHDLIDVLHLDQGHKPISGHTPLVAPEPSSD
ncbi:heme utilization protein HutZ [Pseudaeromonas sharmana]|uniref:Heme utilization protein HutZ n=1 Tax=Pseudaeromonas sharmana TaxID=328412 RepID=A0ABV8CR60_9GAMM